MPESLSSDQLRQLARHGAAARIQELQAEIAAIRSAFPDLGGARRGRPPRKASAGGGTTDGRRPRRMSAAARKAVSERMKKYWAARRRAKK